MESRYQEAKATTSVLSSMFYTEYVSFYQVATCFLELYQQWHSTTSQADEKWTEDFFNNKLGGKSMDKIDVKDFAIAFGGALQGILAIPPKDRTIGR